MKCKNCNKDISHYKPYENYHGMCEECYIEYMDKMPDEVLFNGYDMNKSFINTIKRSKQK